MTSLRMMARALKQAEQRNPGATPEELCEIAADTFRGWVEDAARERDEHGIEDTPCIESCDTGTGEGRYHGRIG